jgi:hypothetical protein
MSAQAAIMVLVIGLVCLVISKIGGEWVSIPERDPEPPEETDYWEEDADDYIDDDR